MDKILRMVVADLPTSKVLLPAVKQVNYKAHGLNTHPLLIGELPGNEKIIIGHFTSSDYKKIQGEDATIVNEVKDNDGFVQQIIAKANDTTKMPYTITNNASPTGTTSMFVAHEKPTLVPKGTVLGTITDNQPANNMNRAKCFNKSVKLILAELEKLNNKT